MSNIFRFRNVSLVLGTLATFLLVLLSDPDLSPGWVSMVFGANTLLTLKSVVALSLACLVIHLSRKTLFDYLETRKLINKAMESPVGAGLALIFVALMMIAVAMTFVAISLKI